MASAAKEERWQVAKPITISSFCQTSKRRMLSFHCLTQFLCHFMLALMPVKMVYPFKKLSKQQKAMKKLEESQKQHSPTQCHQHTLPSYPTQAVDDSVALFRPSTSTTALATDPLTTEKAAVIQLQSLQFAHPTDLASCQLWGGQDDSPTDVCPH